MQRATLPTPAELRDIYSEDYFIRPEGDVHGQGYSDYVGDAALHGETARERLDMLELKIERGRLLDVGAAAGFFVAEATARGWLAQGLDVSQPMVVYAREILSTDVALGDIADIGEPRDSYDAITMWDYIEHSVRPREDVRRAFSLLRDGGVLALSTGDIDSVVARLSGRRWHLLTPRHHNFFFSATTLVALLEAEGFHVECTGHPGHRYTVRYLTHKLQTGIRSRPLRSLNRLAETRGFGSWKVRVNLRDIITLVARKPSVS